MLTPKIAHERNFGPDFDLHTPTKKVRVNIDSTLGRNADGTVGSGRTYDVSLLNFPANGTQAQINSSIEGALPADAVYKVGDRAAIQSGNAKGAWFLDGAGNWIPEPALARIGIQYSPFKIINVVDTGTSGIESILLPSSLIAGSISVGASTQHSGGILAAPLSGATGTASTAVIVGGSGEYLNAIRLRRPQTWTWNQSEQLKLLSTPDGDRMVFGLIQCAAGTADGAAIAASNLQMSFAYEDAAGVLQLQQVVGPIEFQLPYAVSENQYPLDLT